MTTYNGYSNRETWSAALWINNDYGFYKFVTSLVHNGVTEWKDVSKLLTINFGNSCNPDGISWALANEEEMNEVLAEF